MSQRKPRTVLIVLLVLLLSCGAATAQTLELEPVVVTATRTSTPLSRVASSVTVVTAEQIEEQQHRQVLDVLRRVPGVTIIHSGPRGGQTSVRMRGTDNKHTLILVDGVEFRDAASIGGGADLAHFSTANIERIEIVRGPQSVIYGSDAIGGVINIITKRANADNGLHASVEGGSYATWLEKAGFSVSGERVRTALTLSRSDSEGFSSYNEDDGFSEDDGYENTSVSLNSGIDLTEVLILDLTLHLADAEYEFDTGEYDALFNYVRTDTDAVVDSRELTGRVAGTLSLLDGRWTLVAGASLTDTERDTSGSNPDDNYEYDGDIKKYDLQNTIRLSGQQTLVVGIETERESYRSSYGDRGDARTHAAFIQDQVNRGNFSAALGLRYDRHEEFGGELTWRIAPTYRFSKTGTRLKGSAGTGFKAPSLFQLYYPYGGNANLDPETSLGFDIGFEQPLFSSSLILSLTWFRNDIDDYIDYYDDGDFDFFDGDGYQNISELRTQGIESTLEWYPSDVLNLILGYTYTDTRDETGARRARIPLNKGSLDLTCYPIPDLQFTTGVAYYGERNDGASGETLDAYTLVNLAASYQVNEHWTVFGRVDNLFDEDYEEVAGYGTAGLSGYAGLKMAY